MRVYLAIICEPCHDCKYTDCVAVCPVECFWQDEKMLYVDPVDCIDCEACIPECPVQAIYPQGCLPEKWQSFVQINSERSAALKKAAEGHITTKSVPREGPGCRKRT